jgi:hypothetical protein
MTISITTISIKSLYVTLSIIYTQQKRQSALEQCHYADCHHADCRYADCRYADCHYAEYRDLFTIMLSVVILNVVVPSLTGVTHYTILVGID